MCVAIAIAVIVVVVWLLVFASICLVVEVFSVHHPCLCLSASSVSVSKNSTVREVQLEDYLYKRGSLVKNSIIECLTQS